MINRCNQFSQNRNIPVSENGRTFRVINDTQKYINKVEVDGCYITNGAKCDWLFEVVEKDLVSNVFYVELKGSDISHAIVQLETTISHCEKFHSSTQRQAYIVASKVPKSGTSSQVYKKNFTSKNNIQLFIDTNRKEVTI